MTNRFTLKERIINRLNQGFGYSIPSNAPYCHHQATFCQDGRWSWSISLGSHDIGSAHSMKECLSWKKWCIDLDLFEIFEYHDNIKPNFYMLIENEKGK